MMACDGVVEDDCVGLVISADGNTVEGVVLYLGS